MQREPYKLLPCKPPAVYVQKAADAAKEKASHAAGATKDTGAHLAEAARDRASHAAASLQEGGAQAASAARDKGHETAEAVRSNTQVPGSTAQHSVANLICTPANGES